MHHLVFAVILVDQVLLLLNNLVALFELLCAVLSTHVFGKVGKVTACDVDHVLLGDLRT
jgi:hypothetical protein